MSFLEPLRSRLSGKETTALQGCSTTHPFLTSPGTFPCSTYATPLSARALKIKPHLPRFDHTSLPASWRSPSTHLPLPPPALSRSRPARHPPHSPHCLPQRTHRRWSPPSSHPGLPCAMCHVPCAMCHVPCAMCHVPCAMCHVQGSIATVNSLSGIGHRDPPRWRRSGANNHRGGAGAACTALWHTEPSNLTSTNRQTQADAPCAIPCSAALHTRANVPCSSFCKPGSFAACRGCGAPGVGPIDGEAWPPLMLTWRPL